MCARACAQRRCGPDLIFFLLALSGLVKLALGENGPESKRNPGDRDRHDFQVGSLSCDTRAAIQFFFWRSARHIYTASYRYFPLPFAPPSFLLRDLAFPTTTLLPDLPPHTHLEGLCFALLCQSVNSNKVLGCHLPKSPIVRFRTQHPATQRRNVYYSRPAGLPVSTPPPSNTA